MNSAAVETSRRSPTLSSVFSGVEWALRLFLGSLFIYTGLLKIYDPLAFLDSVYKYRLLGESAGIVFAFSVPVLELSIGGSLIAGVVSRTALTIGFMMLTVFALAQASAWYRGLQIDCGCFGPSAPGGSLVGAWTIARTTGFALIAMLALVASKWQYDARGEHLN